MNTTVTISPEVIRARVKALVALHVSIADIPVNPITDDHNAALNQAMVFAFSHALVNVAPWVESYKIEPLDFHDNPDSLLMLEVEFKLQGAETDPMLVRRALEEYIAERLLLETLPDCPLTQHYASRAADSLARFVELLSLPAAGSALRISRTI